MDREFHSRYITGRETEIKAQGNTDKEKTLRSYMLKHGFKGTKQRRIIVDAFFDFKSHVSIEELYESVKKVDSRIGFATVYRTMKLLKDCGLAVERNFGDGHSRFEPLEQERHHDHMVCTNCGKIMEFESPDMEALQKTIAARKGFEIAYHKMEIYGTCKECRTT